MRELRTLLLLPVLFVLIGVVGEAADAAGPGLQDPPTTPPPTTTGTPPANQEEPPANQEEQRPRGEGRRGGRRGGQDGEGRRGGRRGAGGQDGEGGDKKPARPKPPRRGIPVDEPLLTKWCGECHATNDKGHMSRISYMRKAPEGWEITLKRMLRRHEQLRAMQPDDARKIIRYLSDFHGLARSEAERSLHFSERRVHWSEKDQDKDLRDSCAACHSLGRVLAQQRDAEEWKHLKAMHLAMYPLANSRFRGRGRRGGSGGSGGGRGGRGGGGGASTTVNWQEMSPAEIEEAMRRRNQPQAGGDRADRVLGALAKSQGLLTPEWEDWMIDRREVPLAGKWTVTAHETGRGDLIGHVIIERTGDSTYRTRWSLEFEDGSTIQREGKGILYAGYSWRGRSKPVGAKPDETGLREVLLLSEDWNHFKGRIFTGAANEFGADVELHRHIGVPRIFGVAHGAVMTPSRNHEIDVWGEAFPPDVRAGDFFAGAGVTVSSVRRISPEHVRITVDAARDAEQGPRRISFRNSRGPKKIVLYDTIDYIDIWPKRGMSRIGGARMAKQYERFEAFAMNQGPDGKPQTKDDFRVKYVNAKWHMSEFFARDDDDDIEFVGTLDPDSALFTPNVDGPNLARKWQANNVGDVYVVATTTLTVQKRPEKKKDPEKKKEGAETAGGDDKQDAASNGNLTGKNGKQDATAKKQEEPEKEKPVVMEKREFKARAHLLVTVPLYRDLSMVLNWSDDLEDR